MLFGALAVIVVAPALEPNKTRAPPVWLSVVLAGCVPALKEPGNDEPMNMVTVPLLGVKLLVATVRF